MAPVRTAEHQRLIDSELRKADWKCWGPYVSLRAWGTVREDYSADGDAWRAFPHDHALSRAYRWNEDGIGGFCNRFQNVCMALSLWNERDPFLKERFFGLGNHQGNHGEDVKEYFFHLDATPTHSYMKMLYKYPQVEFPYERLIAENARRGYGDGEYELIDALRPDFEANRYFDVFIEYAKRDEDDILCRIRAVNRGPEPAPIHLLPHLWYRNVWSWGYGHDRPVIRAADAAMVAVTEDRHLGRRWWYVRADGATASELLFTENETNNQRLFGAPNAGPYVKDGIDDAVVRRRRDRVNSAREGSKVAAHCHAVVAPGEALTVSVRFTDKRARDPFEDFDAVFTERIREADEFHAAVAAPNLDDDQRRIQRQAFANLLWSKQFYHYSAELWLQGDPAGPAPPPEHQAIRNSDWSHLYCLDVLSVPDKWEYPYFCAWDLAFHTLPIAMVDPEWAKRQLTLMVREWYMHPNGQIPAYEWNFSDVNPPVHAWAAWHVYKLAQSQGAAPDVDFLERIFHKLLLNFTWWVNRKDDGGKNIFQGGFLGMDNIGLFDRSAPLPSGAQLEQADGTAWMGMYCLNMLAIALELARTNDNYEDVATKFFEHFIYIADAINKTCDNEGLWDAEDGFYYDHVRTREGASESMKIRSFVGLIPLFAAVVLDADLLERLPRFRRRMEWFIEYRPHLVDSLESLTEPGVDGSRLLSIVDRNKLQRILPRMLDNSRFLSDYGVRTLSRQHLHDPFRLCIDEECRIVRYVSGESDSGMFGGNSNWRGPIWFPVNYLMIEALRAYHRYYGDSLQVELPTYSENFVPLDQVATDLGHRLMRLFARDEGADGGRPVHGVDDYIQRDPHWRDYVRFHEYFDGETGQGLGASHQGWTTLVACLIQQCAGKAGACRPLDEKADEPAESALAAR